MQIKNYATNRITIVSVFKKENLPCMKGIVSDMKINNYKVEMC